MIINDFHGVAVVVVPCYVLNKWLKFATVLSRLELLLEIPKAE